MIVFKRMPLFLMPNFEAVKLFWRKLTHWELWPFYIIYAPLGFVWLYYALRARRFWFFSNVNPTLEFAGFEGENKKPMYKQLPQKYYPKTCYINAGETPQRLLEAVYSGQFTYPFIVKPQVGMQGLLFRKIENEAQLLHYHHCVQVDYMLQEFIDYPLECSVFYIRYPNSSKGFITGFVLKEYLSVTGDGSSTLEQLILKHSKARYREAEMRERHAQQLYQVLPEGEVYYLSIAGNHNRGAKFINLQHEIDERLCAVFDTISKEAKHFYYGRFDLKFASLEALKQGKDFFILEFNGAGAEPNHIYDCNMSYTKALRVIINHWHHWYKIGRINYKQGIPYWSFLKGYRYLKQAKQFFKQLEVIDLQHKENSALYSETLLSK